MATQEEELELEELTPGATFVFHCHPGVPCFNACCAQTTIILSPYDVLRLKQHLGLTAAEFLERYTQQDVDEASGLPLVRLRMQEDARRTCPFAGPAGCRVYPDRPATCRYYPVGVGHYWTRAGLQEGYVLVREEHCQGAVGGKTWTLDTWKQDQGLAPYEEMNRLWREIMLRVAARQRRPVGPRFRDHFYRTAYDLDAFRRYVFETDFLQIFAVEPEVLAACRKDDLALLRFAFRYLKFMLRLENSVALKLPRRCPAAAPMTEDQP